jgi:hypothetical protein
LNLGKERFLVGFSYLVMMIKYVEKIKAVSNTKQAGKTTRNRMKTKYAGGKKMVQ